MANVSPRANDAFFLRLLLLHVRGCTSYTDIRRVVDNDGIEHVCPTFHDACLQRGLLADDSEWYECMDEAMLLQTNYTHILQLVAVLCIWCELRDPRALWDHYKPDLLESVQYRYPSLVTEFAVENELLHELQREFIIQDYKLSDFGLPPPRGLDNPPPPPVAASVVHGGVPPHPRSPRRTHLHRTPSSHGSCVRCPTTSVLRCYGTTRRTSMRAVRKWSGPWNSTTPPNSPSTSSSSPTF
jgi:hypothetical protein